MKVCINGIEEECGLQDDALLLKDGRSLKLLPLKMNPEPFWSKTLIGAAKLTFTNGEWLIGDPGQRFSDSLTAPDPLFAQSELLTREALREALQDLPYEARLVVVGVAWVKEDRLEYPDAPEEEESGWRTPGQVNATEYAPILLKQFRIFEAPTEHLADGEYGRLKWGSDFNDLWIAGEHYNLRGRQPARECIKYLVQQNARDPGSARSFAKDIARAVREKVSRRSYATSEPKIHHYFNGRLKKLQRELIGNVKRSGRYYLRVE